MSHSGGVTDSCFLTLIWNMVGFLGVCFEAGEVKLRPHPCLKRVRIMLKPSNLPHKYKHIFNFKKYTFY